MGPALYLEEEEENGCTKHSCVENSHMPTLIRFSLCQQLPAVNAVMWLNNVNSALTPSKQLEYVTDFTGVTINDKFTSLLYDWLLAEIRRVKFIASIASVLLFNCQSSSITTSANIRHIESRRYTGATKRTAEKSPTDWQARIAAAAAAAASGYHVWQHNPLCCTDCAKLLPASPSYYSLRPA